MLLYLPLSQELFLIFLLSLGPGLFSLPLFFLSSDSPLRPRTSLLLLIQLTATRIHRTVSSWSPGTPSSTDNANGNNHKNNTRIQTFQHYLCARPKSAPPSINPRPFGSLRLRLHGRRDTRSKDEWSNGQRQQCQQRHEIWSLCQRVGMSSRQSGRLRTRTRWCSNFRRTTQSIYQRS